MIDATTVNVIYEEQLRGPYQIVTYEIPSVAGNTESDMIRVELPKKVEGSTAVRAVAMLKGIKMACDSTGFNIAFFNRSDGVENTLNECVRYTGINKYEYESEMTIPYINRDDTQGSYIYCKIENNEVNATGTFNMELYLQ